MKKRKLLFTALTLAMGFLAGGSDAMAESSGWDAVYGQSQYSSDDWIKLSSGSTSGITLGSGSATTYYYIDRSLNFTNNNGSGIKIQGTVYLYIPAGLTLHCEGSDANGQTGAGAGIELSSGNTLYIIGGGAGTTVTAIGGKAANGGNGYAGGNAGFNESADIVWPGAGGNGGNGGGGAGAGIGSRGGNGGSGGAGGDGPVYAESTKHDGKAGSSGSNGGTAAAMGNFYVDQTFGITVNATGGSQGSTGGTGGNGGSNVLRDGGSNDSMAGGAGGGGGGFGGSAANIGTGGCGGGGGGGGAGGSVAYAYSTVYSVGANGGHPGANGNGTFNTTSGFGNGTLMAAGTVIDHEGDNMNCVGWEDGRDNRGAGGGSGDRGNVSSNGTTNAGTKSYNITYIPVTTKVNGENTNTVTVQYSPSAATNVVLPQNTDGYQWVLLVYGKSCAPDGTSASEFATASKAYYGGDVEELARTIVLAHVYGDLTFQEIPTRCNIQDRTNNYQLLEDAMTWGYPVTARLLDRTLYRDNHYNTICLPFDMTASQYSSSPLMGATIMKMDQDVTGYYANGVQNPSTNEYYNYPIVLLWFTDADPAHNGLQKGKPYLVKWAEKSDMTSDGDHVDNTHDTEKDSDRHELDFANVTIGEKTAGSWETQSSTSGVITFQGTFGLSADLNGPTRLLLGGNDTLYYPSTTMNVGACRGYFIIPEAAANGAKQFVMGFDDEEETTAIKMVNGSWIETKGSDTYYNLNGQRLSAPQKGINIVNGKKVVIK